MNENYSPSITVIPEMGGHIRTWRRLKGLSIENIGSVLGMSREDVIRLEAGFVYMIIPVIYKYCEAVGVSEDLFRSTLDKCLEDATATRGADEVRK